MTSNDVANSGSASVTQSTAARIKTPLMNAASRGTPSICKSDHETTNASLFRKSLCRLLPYSLVVD